MSAAAGAGAGAAPTPTKPPHHPVATAAQNSSKQLDHDGPVFVPSPSVTPPPGASHSRTGSPFHGPAAAGASSQAAAAAAAALPPLPHAASTGGLFTLMHPAPGSNNGKSPKALGPGGAEVKEWTREELHGKILLFAFPTMANLAQEIVRLCHGKVVLGQVSWSRFPDGFPNLFIHSAKSIKYADCAFLGSMHSPDVIFEQLSFMNALPRYFAKSLTVLMPYFATGTMERVSVYGEVATANSLARMLSMIPSCKQGPPQICIFDIHTLQNQFYFRDEVLVRLKSCVHLLVRTIKRSPELKQVTICFPDDGAHKRFAPKFKAFPLITCHKVRAAGDARVVTIKDGDAKGRHCIIVDDLVQSGGTMIECSNALRAAGAAHVSAYVTHPIFPNESWKKFVHTTAKPADPVTGAGAVEAKKGAGAFEAFWVCNTHPSADLVRDKVPFRVLSVAAVAAQVLLDTLPLDTPNGGGGGGGRSHLSVVSHRPTAQYQGLPPEPLSPMPDLK